VVYVPSGSSEKRKRWIVPVSAERVPSEQKGHELGMKQVARLLTQLGLEESFTRSISDSAYTTESCLKTVSKLKENVHIARLRNNRKVFAWLPVQRTRKENIRFTGKR
jgi:hypothetical protein